MAVALPMAGAKEDVWVPTACDMCYNGCTVKVHRVDGVAVKVEGIPEAGPNYGMTCAKGLSALMNVYSPNRVAAPMVRTNPEKGLGIDPGWREISWDEAMDLFVAKLEAARAKDPRSIAGQTFDRVPSQILRAFLYALGSPNVTPGSAAFFCGNGTHPVAFMLTGANDVHPDLHVCNHLLMFGTSYGFVAQMNAMGLTKQMADARARGMKLTVVDPVLTYAASHADEWIPIRPGTDTAFAMAIMHEWVVELDHYDKEFLKRYTNATYLIGSDGRYVRDPESGKPLVGSASSGSACPFDAISPDEMALDGEFVVAGTTVRPSFVAFKEQLQRYTPEYASEVSSVPPATIRRLARDLARTAQIGQTIVIDGETLPLRPVAAAWYRGISAHKHAMLNGMAVGLLNVLLGAVDVPGGILNASGSGPTWMPKAEDDGLIVPGSPFGFRGMASSLPRRGAKPPESLSLTELFPIAYSSGAAEAVGLLRGEEFGLPYKCEVLIQCRDNIMATGGDPEIMADALRTIPFIVSMNTFHDETSEFADLLLPDAHALERLVPLVYNPYSHYANAAGPFEHYGWNIQQPVVKAVPQARFWGEVLFEAAERLGTLADMYSALNAAALPTRGYQLDRARTYSWEEVADLWIKSVVGGDHGLDYFKEHGFYKSDTVRGVRAAYPRPFHGARIPLYLEHLIDAGESVRAYADTRGVEWDTSDYVPLIEWKACLTDDDAPAGYDMWVVNQKLPFMTFSFTAENPWLMDLAKRNSKVFNIGINRDTAARKGIKDGDTIVFETPQGKKASGVARLTEGVHPDCLAIPGVLGRRAVGNADARGRGIHFNAFLSNSLEHMDMLSAGLDACVKVKVSRA